MTSERPGNIRRLVTVTGIAAICIAGCDRNVESPTSSSTPSIPNTPTESASCLATEEVDQWSEFPEDGLNYIFRGNNVNWHVGKPLENGRLEITRTPDGDIPMTKEFEVGEDGRLEPIYPTTNGDLELTIKVCEERVFFQETLIPHDAVNV